MLFIGLKSCDTCRKALKMLGESAITPEVVDVRTDGLAPQHIAALLAAFGDGAINRASTTWRGLSDAEKASDPATLLAAHPTLLKRPAILHEGRWYQGWKADVQKAVLG